MSSKGRLIVFSSPSGAGKTTLITRLRKDYPELEFSISATTRTPRGIEKDGVEYFFLSETEFEEKTKKDEFAEFKTVYGNLYGTLRSFINKSLKEGKNIIFDVDVQGGLAIKEKYPNDVVMIFIYPPSLEDLKERLELRGTDSKETIEKRLKFAKIEMEKMKEYSYNIENYSVEEAYIELKRILSAEGIIKFK
ncbi:MAG: guanylate kinase [Candidatus Delongbacteria bacterium]|nr:guanylate kinase [Candidatus Delongbacteria bacterium]MCG2761053.1 guanylate kinase [Candidatus Delongbacteria bacterium]